MAVSLMFSHITFIKYSSFQGSVFTKVFERGGILNGGYSKGVPQAFLSKRIFKRVRVCTQERSLPIYNVDETPLPWPLPQCSRTFKRKKVPGGLKMVKRCWNFFKFPLIKWKVILMSKTIGKSRTPRFKDGEMKKRIFPFGGSLDFKLVPVLSRIRRGIFDSYCTLMVRHDGNSFYEAGLLIFGS